MSAESLTINKSFADKYAHNKEREESTRARELGVAAPGDKGSDSSSSSSEDSDAELLTRSVDKQIQRTLEMIKRGDPAIYDANTQLYNSDASSDSDDDAAADSSSSEDDSTDRSLPALSLSLSHCSLPSLCLSLCLSLSISLSVSLSHCLTVCQQLRRRGPALGQREAQQARHDQGPAPPAHYEEDRCGRVCQ